MKKSTLFMTIALALVAIVACKKSNENDIWTSVSIPTATQFKAIQDRALENIIQSKTFDAEDGLVFESEKGTIITIYPGCLVRNGIPVTGEVKLKFAEIFDKGMMLATNKTTIGRHPNGSYEQLISGGEFLIEVYQGEELLELSCGMSLSVLTDLTGGTSPDMKGFVGDINSEGDLIWEQSGSEFWSTQRQTSGGVTTEVYQAIVDSFGWFNCDYFANFTGPKTAVRFRFPTGFSFDNASVYVAIPGQPNSLAAMYGDLPIGETLHLIFLTAEGDNFRYAIKTVTIENNQTVFYNIEDTQVTSADGLVTAINTLP